MSRLALLIPGGALIASALIWVGCELTCARVPQHRAALEELIRHETGLELRFSGLSLRWGWHGPEAVFQGVVLGERGGGVRLRAPRLIVGLDAWRMVRSGHLEAARIVLESPDIDLSPGASTVGERAVQADAVWGAGARMLSGWRGGRIEIERGTLRGLLPYAAPAVLNVRYAQLRRYGAQWSADALVLLPESLGSSAHVTVRMQGDPAHLSLSGGTVSLEGRGLEFPGWHALAARYGQAVRYLPRAGRGDLDVHLAFTGARVQSAAGNIRAEALEWGAPSPAAAPLALDRVAGAWQLTRRGGEWHLAVDALKLTASAGTAASLSVDAAADLSQLRGQLRHAPLPVLAALAQVCAPQLPLGELALEGEARELAFDWNAHRPAGARFLTTAELEDLALGTAAHEVRLSGLSGRLSGRDGRWIAELQAHGAQLALVREKPLVLGGFALLARLAADSAGGGWRLSSEDLEVRREGLSFAASGAIGAAAGERTPRMSAHLVVKGADVGLLNDLLGPRVVNALGGEAARITAGRIANADLEWRGPLEGTAPWNVPGGRFSGALVLREAKLSAGGRWPALDGLDAHLDWRGPHFHALIERARSGTFQIASASAVWDARGTQPLRFTALLRGRAEEARGWLGAHAALVPGAADVDLRGDALLDIDIVLPADAARTPGPPPRGRIVAVLDGAQLRPLAGLPPIVALRGTVAFAGGHLQRSTLTGQWLGGPVSLSVGEQREPGFTLTIAGRGLVDARQALLAAGAVAEPAQLTGNAEWNAVLKLLPATDPQRPRWQLRADSNLVGVTSHLPEPFAKAAGSALPLHVELQAAGDAGQLRIELGERLRALAALARSGEVWRLERGAVRLASTAPSLPAERVLLLDGRVSGLDLTACLALWRLAGRDAALPPLRTRLTAAQLLAGTRSYGETSLLAQVSPEGGALQLQSAEVSASARWPAVIDGAHPAVVRLGTFNIAQPGDAALAGALASALAPSSALAVEDLRWRGRSLGRLSASLASVGGALEVSDLQLSGASGDTHASVRCEGQLCRGSFGLESQDAAATLAAFGLRPELRARRARFEGELQWSPEASSPLATLGGRLHLELQDGTTHAVPGDEGVPFALLSVPALIGGMSPEALAQPELGFTRLTADFELTHGQAITPDLHFDGDAEILVRGRVGLATGDFDEQAWILRGEERLPAAVRRLGPTPRVAAVWLSLREWLSGAAPGGTRAALRLRGTWNDPIVMSAE